MKYEELKNFILNEMKMQQNRNYQPVMIRFLNQNKGKAARKQIQQALHDANPEFPVNYFNNSPVFDVLTTSHPVADYNQKEDTYSLFDYDTFTPAQKAHITMYCDEKIQNSTNPPNNRIILFSVAGKKSYEHYSDTITNDVDTSSIPGQSLLKDFPAVRVWGSVYHKQNYNKWKDLKKGDVLLFYHNKKYITSTILEGTEQNQEVADSLWGRKDEESNKSFELLMFMLPLAVHDEDVDYHKLNQLLGYEEEFMPTRTLDFTTVNKKRTDELIAKFGSIENALRSIGFSFEESGNIMGQLPQNIEELIRKYDKNRFLFSLEKPIAEELEKVRLNLVTRFPIDKILQMKIDEYVAGKPVPETGEVDRSTFCYLLERGVPGFGGIGGTPASKFGIYFSKSKNEYVYKPDFNSSAEAFTAIKNDIKGILDAGTKFEKDGNWENLSKAVDNRSDHLISSHIRSKILAVYFWKNCLDIHSGPALRKLMDEFKIPKENIEYKITLMQGKLLEIKNSHPIMKNWTIQDYSHFIWMTFIENEDIETEVSEIELETQGLNYLLLRHNPPEKRKKAERKYWDDLFGKEYHFGKTVPNHSKIIPGSKTVWFYTDKDDLYLWGYGDVDQLHTLNNNEFIASMKNFHSFSLDSSAQKCGTSIQKKIKSLKGWNKFNSAIEINKEIYDEIVNSTSQLDSFVDQPLAKPSSSEIKAGLEKIKEELLIPDEKIIEIVTSLASGSHVILAGPIGTGKTELARKIPPIFWSKNGGYYSDIFTATADWNTQDVIGGIIPKMDGDKVKYKIQDGCVTESVRKNWDGKLRKYHSEGGNFRGVWTIIDEFNRADIDKAFGQLFTALRTRELKVPTDLLNELHESLTIPKDFRIIGTLNTADKHYLFPLSNALKSRFAFIEVDVPDPTLRDEEIYYAMKNAIDSFDGEDFNSIVSLGDKQKIIKRNEKFYAAAYQAYNFLAFVRLFKKLGTAILKIIFQNLLAGAKMSLNFNDVLDNAINSTIMPQLEGMSESELNAIKVIQSGKISEEFKKWNSTTKRNNYDNEFKKTLEFLEIKDKTFEEFSNTEIKDDAPWNNLQDSFDNRQKKTEDEIASNLTQVEKSLNAFIQDSVI